MSIKTPNPANVEKIAAFHQKHYEDLVDYAMIMRRKERLESDQDRGEDAVQEAFLMAWRDLEDFARSENPIGWLYRALYYAVRHQAREESRWVRRLQVMEGIYEGITMDAYHQEDMREEYETLAAFLTEKDIRLLKNYFSDGYSREELAELTGTTKQGITMRIRRLKLKIAKKVGPEKIFVKFLNKALVFGAFRVYI